MTNTRIAALALTLCLGVSPVANAATIDFKALADGALGESAWDPLHILISPGFTLDITGSGPGGSDAYAYLDSRTGPAASQTAGLGVCGDLITGAPVGARPGLKTNICDPSSDDNVKGGETLHLVFNQKVVITGLWFNNNHDTDFLLNGNTISIGGAAFLFNAGHRDATFGNDWKVSNAYIANTSIDIAHTGPPLGEQFYLSKMEVTAVPEPASVFGAGLGVLGIGLLRRYFNRPLR
jgi:hypothetical protein